MVGSIALQSVNINKIIQMEVEDLFLLTVFPFFQKKLFNNNNNKKKTKTKEEKETKTRKGKQTETNQANVQIFSYNFVW